MEEKKINKSLVFSIIAVLLLVIVVAGSTYAYFRAAGETAVQEITTADLGISFVEGELFNAKLEPILREDILTKAAKKTFTITNTGEEKLFVHISMEDMVLPEALKRYDFMWSLYEGDKNVSNGSFEGLVSTSVEVGPYQVFEKGASKTYHLYVWIEETGLDQTTMMGQTFNTKIKAIGETYYTTPEGLGVGSDGSLYITELEYFEGEFIPNVIIPETIGSVAVTSVSNYGFHLSKPDVVGTIVIPNSVTKIGDHAFHGAEVNVIIPNSVTELGEKICEYGSISTSIPNSITKFNGAFSDCAIGNIIIPNGVTEIGGWDFFNSTISSIIIPNSVTIIGDGAFGYNQLKILVIGNNVTSIGANAFDTNQLTSVVIPSSVTEIGADAFANNPNLTSIIIKRSNSDGMTLGENWSGSCPTENIIYNSSY